MHATVPARPEIAGIEIQGMRTLMAPRIQHALNGVAAEDSQFRSRPVPGRTRARALGSKDEKADSRTVDMGTNKRKMGV